MTKKSGPSEGFEGVQIQVNIFRQKIDDAESGSHIGHRKLRTLEIARAALGERATNAMRIVDGIFRDHKGPALELVAALLRDARVMKGNEIPIDAILDLIDFVQGTKQKELRKAPLRKLLDAIAPAPPKEEE